jgi:RHS repeat-associated protein
MSDKQDTFDLSGSRPLEAPAITLPRGGGALQGIGEKFQVNAVTGTGSLSVPLAMSRGRSDSTPQLALGYDSGGGNSAFGIGWSLGVASIRRKTQKGLPQYIDHAESDVYLLSGAEDLVPVSSDLPAQGCYSGSQGGDVDLMLDGEAHCIHRYRPRVEGLFARIERWVRRCDGDVHWRATTGDNRTAIYGRDPAARIADPADPSRVFEWLLEQTFDDKGNLSRYQYKPESEANIDPGLLEESNRLALGKAFAQVYLKQVLYGNSRPYLPQQPGFDRTRWERENSWHFRIVFDYGEHAAEHPTAQEANAWPVRRDPFSSYRAGFEIRSYRLCRRVLMFHEFAELGETPLLVRSTNLSYDESPVATQLRAITYWSYQPGQAPAALPPLAFRYTQAQIDDTILSVAEQDLENLPQGLGGAYRWVDLAGEGLSGVLSQYENAWYYKPNLGDGHFGPKQLVGFVPSLARPSDARQQLLDLDGDGSQDLVLLSRELNGFYSWRDLQQAETFRAFDSIPSINWADPFLRMVDLSGDGHADILITEDDCFVWYPSRARAGFAPAERVTQAFDEASGPRLVFADATQTIFIADMCGDGLPDLVRIENGRVCYWPNTGYGSFGARVAMGNAPRFDHPEQFDPVRIRLGDIDGSGTSDIFYLGGDGLRCWFNQSGNHWSEARELPHFPPLDRQIAVDIVDLLGNGTACVVWSSPLAGDQQRQLRYIPLMSQSKPYLLSEVDNNVGGLTRLQYAPSTRFYLEDQRAGRPWATRLPFPVHVLERVEALDQITGTSFVSRYVYHHGYFDGDEREFRGFGMVEQFDSEDFAGFGAQRLFASAASNWAEDSHVAPVYSKSWFHTGFYLNREQISRHYAGEYYQGDPDAISLPDTVLPPDLADDELYQACRALKGSLLRQEVYARDGSAQADHPYSVSEHTYTVRREQPRGANRHAVFFVHPQQSLAYHYEREPGDPRLAQSLTLGVDAYGRTTRAAAIVYPRRGAGHPAEQRRLWISYQEAEYIHLDRSARGYRIGLPREGRSYEVTGPVRMSGGLCTPETLLADLRDAEEIPYHATPDPARVQRRLLGHAQTLYYDDALAAALPPGEAALHGLAFEAYRMVFTPELLASVYAGRVSEAMLVEGGYLEREGAWWAPSGRIVYDPTRFFMPTRQIDPFGAQTALTYDAHDLLLLEIEDALGNRATVGERDSEAAITPGFDYRLLQPHTLSEPNGNRTRVAFDVRGKVVATAVMGKPGAGEGDTLDDPTSRFEYALFNWRDHRRPNVAHGLARERHGAANPRWQESYIYSGGFGQEILTKVQAEPGEAFARDGEGNLLRDADGALTRAFSASRWVGNGRTILDNKGNPVRQYEPYFSSTHAYEDEDELREYGVSPTLRYDPLGRNIRTDYPDGTLARVEFTPWGHRSFDQNDSVRESRWYAERGSPEPATAEPGDPEARAAWLAARHAATPLRAHVDTLGRPFVAIAHNRRAGGDEFIPSHSVLDVEGNPLEIYDGRRCEGLGLEAALSHLGNRVVRYRYAMGGLQLYEASVDAGERWVFVNVAGSPLYRWDSRDQRLRTRYDALQRPLATYLQQGDGQERLIWLTLYGEAHPEAEALNLRGQVFQSYDQAGVITNERFDFKGNLGSSSRRLAADYKNTIDWSALEGMLAVRVLDLAGLEAAASALLEGEAFTSTTEHDALNRPVEIQTPDGSRHLPEYNQANLLERLIVQPRGEGEALSFVERVDYNEKGQRLAIRYGNGVETSYRYDELTYRLTRLHSERLRDGVALQDLSYSYDPVGNIVEIRDQAQQEIFFANQRVAPHSRFVYDARYQLIEATGREQIGQAGERARDHEELPLQRLPHPNNPQAMRRYNERYSYDPAGNILELRHEVDGGGWARAYDYAEDSNRLLGHGGAPDYAYDAHGNMTRMPQLPLMRWDFQDQLQATSRQARGDGTPETTYYVYNAVGQRVHKVTERQAASGETPTRRHERIYLSGVEIYREYGGDGASLRLERETLHVIDDSQRVALVETRSQGEDGSATQLARFQLSNHLGSTALELDQQANLISYEEYHPYGTSAYRSGRSEAEASLKRYRYTGKERDEETGFSYHGARYYASWLGRWTAADPIKVVGGLNRYWYSNNNPVRFQDPSGKLPTIAALQAVTAIEVAEEKGVLQKDLPEFHSEGAEGSELEEQWTEADEAAFNAAQESQSQVRSQEELQTEVQVDESYQMGSTDGDEIYQGDQSYWEDINFPDENIEGQAPFWTRYESASELEAELEVGDVVFGKRPLDISEDGLYSPSIPESISDEHNLEVLHEQAFYKDASGEVKNIGFFDTEEGSIHPDPNWPENASSYRFGPVIHDVEIDEVNFYPEEFGQGEYSLIWNNCQDYCEAIRNQLQ